jgi:hypothetical protein
LLGTNAPASYDFSKLPPLFTNVFIKLTCLSLADPSGKV